MKKLTSISLAIIFLAGLFLGCEKSDNPIVPTLPPEGSMSIDFNLFSADKLAIIESGVNGVASADKSNAALAATIAGTWNLLLGANLAIPVASFNRAVDHTPVYLNAQRWEWKYDFNVAGATYLARLTGKIIAPQVKWEMYIARVGTGAFPELLWYEGTSALDGKSGQWILNHSLLFPEPLLQIDWQVEGTEIGHINYTYIRERKDDRSPDVFKNSYIEYGLTDNTLDAFLTVHQNTGEDNVFQDVWMEFSTTTYKGRIKSKSHFQDELWHCWNEVADNVSCN